MRIARILAALACGALARPAAAQELALRAWGMRDGLVHDRANTFFQDSKGYLWIGTWEGASRFDGARFAGWSVDQGLPVGLVWCIAEDSIGRIWLGTHEGGLACIDGRSGARGSVRSLDVGADPPANTVLSILAEPGGRLLCATRRGIRRVREDAPGELGNDLVWRARSEIEDAHGFRDASGRAWFATSSDLIEIRGDGARVQAWPEGGAASEGVAIAPDGPDRFLIANRAALYSFAPPAQPDGPIGWTRIPVELEGGQAILAVARDPDGGAWIGTTHGLIRVGAAGQERFDASHGLGDDWVRALFVDRDLNLWIGTRAAGIARLSDRSIRTWTRARGEAPINAMRIVESPSGRMYVATEGAGIHELARDGLRRVEGSERVPFHNVFQRIQCDSRGDWWIGTNEGLYRFEGPELALERGRKLGEADGLPEAYVSSAIFEDARARIWVAFAGGDVYSWDRSESESPRFRALSRPGFAPLHVRDFCCDARGALWAGEFNGLWRFDEAEAARPSLRPAVEPPWVEPRCLLADSRGWLWIGLRHRGVCVTRDPAAREPAFERFAAARALDRDAVWSIAEDDAGRVWLGSSRGVVRIDVDSGAQRAFSTADGLAGSFVNHLYRDRAGAMWVCSTGGVARIDPRAPERAHGPPPVYVTRVVASGEDEPVPHGGLAALAGLELAPSQSQLAIEFTAVDLTRADALRFQTLLEGHETSWSEPFAEPSVRYAALAPGSYRFLVRALAEDGRPSAPASVEFRVLAPLWRRPWFAAAALALIGGAAFAFHRARVRRLLALERVRRQIATDLHDEVGSNLAQIAILSEVARRDAAGAPAEKLALIAELARATRASMADLVWSIDPRKDSLVEVVQRMRQTSGNLIDGERLQLAFRAPEDAALSEVELAPDKRRHLLLFFKEALTNVARHARASSVAIDIALAGGKLVVAIQDDGRGFDPASAAGGQGLSSLRRRADALGARLTIDSSPGAGTRIQLALPAA